MIGLIPWINSINWLPDVCRYRAEPMVPAGMRGLPVADSAAPLIVHVIFRLDVGGLENGLVNLLNHIDEDRYRQAVICLADFSDFRQRIHSPDVPVLALHKKEGKDFGLYFRLWRELRRLRPDIMHTRNLGTVDMVFPAWLAGVKYRVHGEHGWDMVDLHGRNKKYLLLRRLCQPMISRYITVSEHLAQWLGEQVGVSSEKIVTVCNGVDTRRFRPLESPPDRTQVIRIGTVGRLAAVKDQLTLVRAFSVLLAGSPAYRDKLKLLIVGDGPMRPEIQAFVDNADLADLVCMPGKQDSVDKALRQLDLFVLPSLNEGISNTILEAMATGLPVIATSVGGNPELVDDGATGFLVPVSDPPALAHAIERYLVNPDLMRRHGRNGRDKAEREYGLDIMVDRYVAVYDELLATGSPD